MPWRTYSCHVCSGYKNLEIGTEINDVQIDIVLCPACDGKGYLHVIDNPYTSIKENFWKRMGNDGGLVG